MIRFTLRIPDGLYARLTEAAEAEHRSANAQILHLIERGLSDDGRSASGAVPPPAGHP